MMVSYNKLWKLLIDKDMMKKELAQKANVSNYTLAKMNKGERLHLCCVQYSLMY